MKNLSKARSARMHATMQRHVGPDALPGLVALVRRDRDEHVDEIGTLAFDSRVPMRRDTICRLASTTKPITAVAAMILVEECKLRLDDPVTDWLPELRDRKVLRTLDGPLDDTMPAARAITLRDLLTFRSGYGELGFVAPMCPLHKAMIEAGLPLAVFPYRGTADELMKRLGELPLAHQPGERWLYHGSADILGVLVARASGKSLGAFMRERIFEPLEMVDTGFAVSESKLDRLATCYAADFVTGKLAVLDAPRGDYSKPPSFEQGAGGLVSTANDLLSFGRMLLEGGARGRERILSRPAIELMTTDQLTPAQKSASPFFPGFWDVRGWGLGMSIVTERRELGIGRFGWDGAFGTSLYVDPKENLIGVLMTQCRPRALDQPAVVLDFWTSAYQLIDD